MAKKRQERREERKTGRRERQDFAKLALEAVIDANNRGEIDDEKTVDIQRALKRPRGIETIRAAFSNEVGPEQLKLGEILTGPDKGKIDFGKLFDLLTGFFPKLANSKAGRLFRVFQRIRDIVKEPA